MEVTLSQVSRFNPHHQVRDTLTTASTHKVTAFPNIISFTTSCYYASISTPCVVLKPGITIITKLTDPTLFP